MSDYYKRRYSILIVGYIFLLGLWAFNWYQWGAECAYYEASARECWTFKDNEPETERVMEWKTAYIECQEDIDRYVEESREIVCWDTLVDWQEQHDKEMARCRFVGEGLTECESRLAALKREYEKQRRMCLECVVADIIKVKNSQ